MRAWEQTPFYARIPGYIKKVNVEMGDTVRKGAVLAELDVPEMEVDMQQEALAQQAEAEYETGGEPHRFGRGRSAKADRQIRAAQEVGHESSRRGRDQ